MKTIIKLFGLFLLTATFQPVLTAQYQPQPNQFTQISYRVPYVSARPIQGSSNQINGEIEYDDTTGVIEELEFEVFLYSFMDDFNFGNNTFIAWLGNAFRFPEMSFESQRIEQDGNKLKINGTMFFRGEYRSVLINATQNENEDIIQLNGNFTIYPRDYISLVSPRYRLPPRVEFQFTMNFDKQVEG